jgi:hypothetical protein
MTRLESSAWSLAGGSGSVFALAVVLDRLPWQAAFAAVALAVAVWAWTSPLVAGAAIAGVAWLCVTGFDVHRLGDVRIAGSDDAARAAVLVLAGLLAAAVHGLAEARSRHRSADPVWADFYETRPRAAAHRGRHDPSRSPDTPPERRGTDSDVATPRTSDRGTE